MQEHPNSNDRGQAKVKEFVVVTFVDEVEQAREYETLLRLNDIPAVIKEQLDGGTDCRAVAIMVPEAFLDEAHVVIESQDAYDDFYDYTMEDEDEFDFDNDLLDDEF